MKIMYAAGPGNVIGTFDYWRKGQDDPSQVSMTFSGQFFDVCAALDAEGYVIASPSEKKSLKDGHFLIEHRPMLLTKQSGILYYLGQILYELSIVFSALRFRADVVIGNSTLCFFVLSLLPKLGIQVVPSLHCVLWPKYAPQSRTTKLLMKINSRFFAKDCLAILSTSEDINEQVNKITNNQPRPIFNFLSTYRKNEFVNIPAPSEDSSTFHVLFAGRLEENKGVFDLLEIAKRFQVEGRNNIVFHVCGTGSAFELLSKQVEASGLQSTFILQGYCNKPKMQQMFSLAHAVIVPTKSNFCEGLNQVVVEGVLAGRPVITSSVCPALSYVREAAIEVPPDDINAYADAVLKLSEDRQLYKEKQQNCQKVQEQFYSHSRSWEEALTSILKALQR